MPGNLRATEGAGRGEQGRACSCALPRLPYSQIHSLRKQFRAPETRHEHHLFNCDVSPLNIIKTLLSHQYWQNMHQNRSWRDVLRAEAGRMDTSPLSSHKHMKL